RTLHHEAVLDDGPGDANDVGFLEGVVTNPVRLHLASDDDDGDGIHVSGGNAGNGIGGARAGGGQYYARFATGTGKAIGHVGGRLLVTNQYVGNAFLLEQCIIYMKYCATGVAENGFNP